MKKLTKLAAALMALSFLMGTVACGGADKGAADATDAAEPEGGDKKGLEKFEGNKMEVADEEEGADGEEGGEEGGE
jgi:hypothetical protein